jgi:hypothetical protein
MSDTPRDAGRTVITDIRIPFGRLVAIMVKLVLASIPALIIVWLIVFAIGIALTGIFGVSFMHMWAGPIQAI